MQGDQRFAWVCGSDGPLSALLTDVLGEAGVSVVTGASPEDVDLILLHVSGPPALERIERLSHRERPQIPIVAVLPFADEELARSALNAGARVTYALGTPLSVLKTAIAHALASRAAPGPERDR